jgi:CobW/HypB/UreG, nucleotide-binding domain
VKKKDSRPWIVVVGGFLGAGKTSFILAACKALEARGLRCACVLNDQGVELVDTQHVQQRGIRAAEVTGGCFCCRFSELLSVLGRLRDGYPDIIFAEPVGSCTDIVATVMRPLLGDFECYRVAPLTVLVDPSRLAELRSGKIDADIAFLMQKQMNEADLICLTKADIFGPVPDLPDLPCLQASSRTGSGVEEWLDLILAGGQQPGGQVLEIDYRRYARAEASLAWLNLGIRFQAAVPLSPASLTGPLLEELEEAMSKAGVAIAHVKVLDRSPEGWVKAAICANGSVPDIEGDLDAGPALEHELNLNLRATGTPSQLQEIVEHQVRRLAGKVLEWRMSCFTPPPPVPERRIA